MIATYAALCWGIFRLFKIPVNGYTLAKAGLGGVFLLSFILLSMNYRHPFTSHARFHFRTTQIVPRVVGIVTEVPVKPNEHLEAGDVLFRIDPVPYQRTVEQLESQLADARQGAKGHTTDYASAAALAHARAADRDRAKDVYDCHCKANEDPSGPAVFSEQQVILDTVPGRVFAGKVASLVDGMALRRGRAVRCPSTPSTSITSRSSGVSCCG